MLMLKLTLCSESIRGLGSMEGIASSQADTYMIGAERNVLSTIPEVTYRVGKQQKMVLLLM